MNTWNAKNTRPPGLRARTIHIFSTPTVMKKITYFSQLLTRMALLAGVACVVPACSQKDDVAPAPPLVAGTGTGLAKADKTQTFYGPAVPLGQGVGRAWVTVNAAGTPVSIGVDASANSMRNQGPQPSEYTFQLPSQVAVAPYDHIELGWNPKGHEPAGIYTFPHFDLHFYMITSAFQATIPFLAPPAFDTAPAPAYMPTAYFMGPGLVPNMGAHAVDLTSPEFQPGGSFTKTFIYGSYNGNITFLEPMFTLAYLNNQLDETFPIRQPQAFQRAGYYPTSYTISYDRTPQHYRISLDNLTYHPAQ